MKRLFFSSTFLGAFLACCKADAFFNFLLAQLLMVSYAVSKLVLRLFFVLDATFDLKEDWVQVRIDRDLLQAVYQEVDESLLVGKKTYTKVVAAVLRNFLQEKDPVSDLQSFLRQNDLIVMSASEVFTLSPSQQVKLMEIEAHNKPVDWQMAVQGIVLERIRENDRHFGV